MKHSATNRVRMIPGTLASLLWGAVLFMQHVICFDIFATNLWYLYVLALGAACIHISLVVFISKQIFCKHLLWVYGSIYALLSAAKLIQLLLRHNYEWYPIGLTIVCLFCDGLGLLISISRFVKKT